MFKLASPLALVLAVTQSPAPLAIRDLDGRTSTPLSPAAGMVHLVFFLSTDCPISARYSPEIDRIVADYRRRGVRTWFVYVESTLTPEAARVSLKEFHPGTSATVAIDTDLALTKAVNATVTPEAAIYTSRGRVYRGRIDDLYEALGRQRRQPTRRDLRLALDAALAGKPILPAETTPVGCFIERNRS